MNAQSPQKSWFAIMSAVFGSSSWLPPRCEGGGLMCESVGKPDLLWDHFDSNQSSSSVDLPLTCHPFLSLCPQVTFAFRSSKVKRLLFDLDSYGGTDPVGTFPLLLKRTDVLAPRLSVVSRWLLRLGSFPVWWRPANVTPISKGSPSSDVANYRLISSALSNTYKNYSFKTVINAQMFSQTRAHGNSKE